MIYIYVDGAIQEATENVPIDPECFQKLIPFYKESTIGTLLLSRKDRFIGAGYANYTTWEFIFDDYHGKYLRMDGDDPLSIITRAVEFLPGFLIGKPVYKGEVTLESLQSKKK